MSNAQPGTPPPGTPPQGPRLRTIILGMVVVAVLLFAFFFTWYQNTRTAPPDPSNGVNSPFGFTGSN